MPKQELSQTEPRNQWSVALRLLVSAALIWHLSAVLLGPLSMPPTLTSDYVMPLYRPYLAATYTHQGYKFFAPEPGPSHLVRYELEFDDSPSETHVFPNLKEQWPRLLYHRHFMLSEFVNDLPYDPNWNPQADWTKIPLSERQARYVRSYANHLLASTGAKRVTLWLQEHGLASPDQITRGMKLDDKRLYRERMLGTYTRPT